MGQKYSCGFLDSLIAEVGGVTLSQLHFDAPSIVKAFRAIRPVAERLGIPPPPPRLAGFGYPHVAALGCEIVFPDNSEPKPLPLISAPSDIDRLAEPKDFLAAPVIRRKLESLARLRALAPEAATTIGHAFEGPVTTAVLLMGQDFLMLPYDDPKRAHRLLEFCTQSAIHYLKTIHLALAGKPYAPGAIWMPDDFAGMFPPPLFEEFVAPYWEMYYGELGATERYLHSELLHAEHLPFLKTLNIAHYDPTVNPYLSPARLREKCPCPFEYHIHAWEIYDLTADQLEAKYRDYAGYQPAVIGFYMDRLKDEPKIQRLLKVARELA